MSTYTKEQLIARINQVTAINKYRISRDPDADGLAMDNELLAIALASLEAEAVAYIRAAHNPDGFCFADGIHPAHRHQKLPLSTLQDGCYWTVTPLYTAPPEPVSVPDEMTPKQASRSYCGEVRGYRDGWNACRAAMLQGADQQQNEQQNIPKIIPFEQWLSQQTGTIDVECGCVMTEVFFHWLRVAYEAGNSPVIPDGWVPCSERMPSSSTGVIVAAPWQAAPGGFAMKWATNCPGHPDADAYGWIIPGASWTPTHWMPLPAALHFREISNSSTKHFRENAETSTKCWCQTCRPVTIDDMRFVVCPECGNKRCPHANDHKHACSKSNEPGQEGSAYPAAPQQEE